MSDVEAELARLIATAPAIDPDAVPPSLETLLAGTEFADQLPRPAHRTATHDDEGTGR